MQKTIEVVNPDQSRGVSLGNIPLFQRTDMAVWLLVLMFFGGSAVLCGGDVPRSILGALSIIVVMFFVSVSIEVVIEILKNVRGLGTLVGFITNGPELLCLVVGLLVGDLLFAASTPLGSNVMNPIMLLASAAITGSFLIMARTYPRYTWVTVGVTASFAVGFFLLPAALYPFWLAAVLFVTAVLFSRRPADDSGEEEAEDGLRRIWFLPAMLVLLVAGYLLDPAVSFAAECARAPKGVIGFFVLATLTSWPEFKSCLVLFRRKRPVSAILNITVSNITNLWLAALGIVVALLLGSPSG